MEERVLRRIEQLVESAESRFPAKLGEEWSGLGRVEGPHPTRSRVEKIEPESVEERYTPRSRLERIEPERLQEQYTPRSRLERIEPERERTTAPRASSTPPVSSRRVATMPSIEQLLKSRATLRQAILLQAILGPPKALQERDGTDAFGG